MKIIAEIGSNWTDLADCLLSIHKAKACGADIVKFQLFTPEEIYGPNAGYMIDLLPHCLKPEWISILKGHADANQIEFMCTAFSAKGYEFIDPYVQRHKIASSEMTDPVILRAVAKLNKEVLLSTAGAEDGEIAKAVQFLDPCPVVIMHCTGDYPAKTMLWDRYFELRLHGYKMGISDHSLTINQDMDDEADPKYYEKHVTFISSETPDAPHSLNEAEFRYFCQGGDESKLCNQDMIKLYRRRVIATKDIPEGESLRLGQNVGIYRPISPSTNHMHPLANFEEMKVNRDISAGETILQSDI